MRTVLGIRLAASLVVASLILAGAGTALARGPHRAPFGPGFHSRVFASAAGLQHQGPKGTEPITQPDDVTYLGNFIYAAFQNGVGPQGQPSSTGNRRSTIVKFDSDGNAVAQWDVTGKCDGLTADPATGKLLATVNEDNHSSIYLIDPSSGPVHYRYAAPLPSHGGTDAITIDDGRVLISASAPGTIGASAPQADYPAVYQATFDAATRLATLTPLFADEDPAIEANTTSPQYGQPERLALTDPDSNEAVPGFAERFGGDFMLTSQGDEEQIFVRDPGATDQSLSVLQLSASVDDSAWPSDSSGTIYTTDNGRDRIDAITGPFIRGGEYAAVTPCDENSAPSTCPAPRYPANYLGEVDPNTGVIARVPVGGAAIAPQGMLFLP